LKILFHHRILNTVLKTAFVIWRLLVFELLLYYNINNKFNLINKKRFTLIVKLGISIPDEPVASK